MSTQLSKFDHQEAFIVLREKIKQVFNSSDQAAAIALIEFETNHGEEAFKNLYGFIRFAAIRGIPEEAIAETIRHDISGRRERTMLPRTYGYNVFINS